MRHELSRERNEGSEVSKMNRVERAERRLWRRQLEIDRHFKSLIDAKKDDILFGRKNKAKPT
jgi:hypothetical protein